MRRLSTGSSSTTVDILKNHEAHEGRNTLHTPTKSHSHDELNTLTGSPDSISSSPKKILSEGDKILHALYFIGAVGHTYTLDKITHSEAVKLTHSALGPKTEQLVVQLGYLPTNWRQILLNEVKAKHKGQNGLEGVKNRMRRWSTWSFSLAKHNSNNHRSNSQQDGSR